MVCCTAPHRHQTHDASAHFCHIVEQPNAVGSFMAVVRCGFPLTLMTRIKNVFVHCFIYVPAVIPAFISKWMDTFRWFLIRFGRHCAPASGVCRIHGKCRLNEVRLASVFEGMSPKLAGTEYIIIVAAVCGCR